MLGRESGSFFSVQVFGLDRRYNKPLPDGNYTRSLLNVRVREGIVQGRGGVDFDTTLSAAAGENILQLAPWISTTLTTTLLRIGPTAVGASVDGAAWSNVTGTALNGAAGDKPQATMFRDYLYIVNDGKDLLRYYTGTGNTTEVAGSYYAKAIVSYEGFLIVLNVSSDGITFSPRRAHYSETPDTDWSECAGNELNFHETRGAIKAATVVGPRCAVIKEDAVVFLTWVGGLIRFEQRLARGSKGTQSPLTVQPTGAFGSIYLGEDYALYMITPNEVIPLPPRAGDILKNDLHKPLVGNCRSAVNIDEDTYSLFFPLDSAGNGGRIDYNFRTSTYSYSTYVSHDWDAVAAVRWAADDPVKLIATADKIAYTLDVQTVKDDEVSATSSTTPSRYVDTDWIRYAGEGGGSALFTGATLNFKASTYGECAISYAINYQSTWRDRKVYKLKPVQSGDEYVTVRYDVDPTPAELLNIRIELIPSTTENPTFIGGWVNYIPEQTKPDVQRTAITK